MSFPRAAPFYAWGEAPGPSSRRDGVEPEPREEESHQAPASPAPGERADREARMQNPLSFQFTGTKERQKLSRVRFSDFIRMTIGLEQGTTREQQNLALRSLAPLLLRLYDTDPGIVQFSWRLLGTVASLLKYRALERIVEKEDKWSLCLVIAKRFRKVPECRVLAQVLEHLKSSQADIRRAATKILGIIGQETKDQRKIATISEALREMTTDEERTIRRLAVHMLDVLEAIHEHLPSLRRSLWARLPWGISACCSSAEAV